MQIVAMGRGGGGGRFIHRERSGGRGREVLFKANEVNEEEWDERVDVQTSDWNRYTVIDTRYFKRRTYAREAPLCARAVSGLSV